MIKAKKITCILLWSFLGVGIISDLIVWFTFNDRFYTYSYNGKEIIKHSWHDIFGVLMLISVVVFVVSAIVFSVLKIIELIKEKKRIVCNVLKIVGIYLLVIIVAYAILLLLWFRYRFTNDYGKSFEFTDGKHTIVIEEEYGWLFDPIDCRVYQIHDNGKVSKIGFLGRADLGADEDLYNLKWHDDRVEITYNTDDNGTMKTEIIRFK